MVHLLERDPWQEIYRLFPPATTPGLDRIQAFLKSLGHPEKKISPCVHIAGTNGKGSTQAFLKSLCEAYEKRVHTFTSPHLIRPHERISLCGHPISDDAFQALLQEIIPMAKRISGLSWFEFITGAAFLAFSRVSADLVILETGMGGRLDATNVCQTPLAVLLTPISYDHQHFLGDNLCDIASEKAGIMKSQVPVFSAAQKPEAMRVLRHHAHHKQCPLFVEGREEDPDTDWCARQEGDKMLYQDSSHKLLLSQPALAGAHQIQNASLALRCFLHMYPDGVDTKRLSRAMVSVSWPGRLQHLKEPPFSKDLIGGREIWVDGAHNPGGAEALKKALEAWQTPYTLIVCLQKNKDAVSFLKALVTPGQTLIVMPCPNPSKGHSPDKLAEIARLLGGKVTLALGPEEAIRRAKGGKRFEASYGKERLVFCGSLTLVADLIQKSTV